MDKAKLKTKAGISKAFGKVLKEARQSKRLSQEALALQAGIDRTYVGLLERGLRHPSVGFLFSVGPVLDVTPAEFVERIEKALRQR